MRTHPLSIVGGVLQENPFFTPAEEFLRELRERRESASQSAAAPVPDEPGTAESLPASALRRCIRDLVGILALPATWGGTDFKSIIDTLLEMMTALVPVEFALAKVAARPDGLPEYFFKAPTSSSKASQRELVRVLDECLKDQRLGVITNPFGRGTLRVVSVPIGLHAKWGTAVAGSADAAFPSLTELLLLSVAANQAAIALEEAHLHSVKMDNLRLEAGKLQAEADLARVRGQLEPHFLLNTLNAIAGLLTVDPTEARQLLASMGELLRDSLRDGDELQPLSTLIGWLRRYANILETRHAGRIVFHWQIADETRDFILRRLLLQPLLENAVQHGALKRPRGGEVTVRTELVTAPDPLASKLVCIIEDNGPGLSTAEPRSGGVGLKLVRQLLALTYGEKARLRLESFPTGTRAIVELPAERAQRRWS